MSEVEKRNKVALGNIPPDTMIMNGILFDVFTGEFIKKQSVWVKDEMIAYVGPDHDPAKDGKTEVIDADGIALLPGLIDGQTYPLSNRSGVEEFIKHVIPAGVTTVVAETMEYAAIVGKDGIEYVAKGLAVDTLINPTMLHLTITHQGYVDIKNRRKVSLEI